MQVRTPSFDFSATPAQWSKPPELSYMMNASSLWIPHLERFLNRVMARALAELKNGGANHEQLRQDVRTFIRQEANHYTLHASFNEVLTRHGYDLAHFEQMFIEQFEELLATRSLAFLCAYCEGFETIGPPSALVWLDEIDDLLEGADKEVVALWKWHLMEEYEHRTVCFDVFNAIHGGYFLRIKGFFFQLKQLQGFSKQVRAYMLETDRAKMTPEEIEESKRRMKKVGRRIAWLTLPRLLKALSPFYSPRRAKEPAMFKSYRAKVEAALV